MRIIVIGNPETFIAISVLPDVKTAPKLINLLDIVVCQKRPEEGIVLEVEAPEIDFDLQKLTEMRKMLASKPEVASKRQLAESRKPVRSMRNRGVKSSHKQHYRQKR